MHAYLIIAKKDIPVEEEIRKRHIFNGFKLLEFPVQKIDDARSLNAFIRLSASEKTAILIKNFQDATEECVNAILKNIEEPQANIGFIIQATSENSILPTIRSRCQIIHVSSAPNKDDVSEMQNFFEMNLSDKAETLFKNKKREEAVTFSEKMIEYLSSKITISNNIRPTSKLIKPAISLHKALKSNGNVNLQLLRFLSHISN